MERKRVLQRDVPALVHELEERGVSELQRHPVRLDGTVLVTWREEAGADLESVSGTEVSPWVLPMVLGFGVAALVVAVLVGIIMLNVA